MSATIRVWTLAAAARSRLDRFTADTARRRPQRIPPGERPFPGARLPQKLAVSGEISAELCSRANDRSRDRR